MPAVERYECLVLGGGNGGMYLAWHLARAGKRTAVIERQWIGGSCPNVACLPSKNEIWSAKVADLVKQAARFGIRTGTVEVDMAAVRQRKREMIEHVKAVTLQEYRSSGTGLILGTGRFTAPRTIEVRLNDGGSRVLAADRVFINLGTHATVPDVPGLAAARPLTHIEALELDRLPGHLIVLGGGYVGVEMAQAYRRFGSRVTIIQRAGLLADRVDADVAFEIHRMLEEDGIRTLLRAQVETVEGSSGTAVRAFVRTTAGLETIEGTDILVTTGRTPNTSGVGLEAAQVRVDANGYIEVNDRLETTAPGVWAIGECCAGNPQFTHVSYDDFRIIRDNLAGASRTRRDRLVPYCMFTDPPLAHVGLTEREAQARSIPVRKAALPVSAVLRAHTTGETRGFMKALIGADDDRILGFTMFGPESGEVLATVALAIQAGVPYTTLRDMVIAHPTMAEGLGSLLSTVPARGDPAPRSEPHSRPDAVLPTDHVEQ
jgi:pyruvate/2-oxoglutarate dehydrogenase complex dihydrolipoamide dehydrogenase (E3) component